MISFAAIEYIVRKRLTGHPPRVLEKAASKTWLIAPATTMTSPASYFLPNQLERVTGWAFSDDFPRQLIEGGMQVEHASTRGFLIKNVRLIDGALYKNDACSFLRARSSRWPGVIIHGEVDRGAVYCTTWGNTYFAQWLMDDCVTYPLACAEGTPITTGAILGKHVPEYKNLLGMKPLRLDNSFFRELVIFNDFGHNENRHQRARAMGQRLLRNLEFAAHPGVFILRGKTGQLRVMRNELEVAEHLRLRRGFRILDPTQADVPTILKTCAGARVVVGVEGSGLAHGIAILEPGAAVLTLQPPDRFVAYYKHHTDWNHQHFGFVVGMPEANGFRIDPDEVERTIDLFPG